MSNANAHTLTIGPSPGRGWILVSVAALALTLAPSLAFATDCVAVLQNVRSEGPNGKAMVRFNNSWHVIGSANGDPDVRRDRLSLATAALLSGFRLALRYGSSYSCSKNNYSEEPAFVQINR